MLEEIRKYLLKAVQQGLTQEDFKDRKWIGVDYLNNPNWLTLQYFENFVHDFEEYGVSIDKGLLNNWIDEVESLIKNVDESQLNDDFKKTVIFKLREIKNTLENYYYYGTDGVKKEIYSALVEIGIIDNEQEQDEQAEDNKQLLRKIAENLYKWASWINVPLNTVVNIDKLRPIVTQTAELISHTIKHLPPVK